MEILGQQFIAARRQQVWDALNDPLILKECLPGCETVERVTPEEFRIVIKTAIGPLKARFQGSLKISEAKVPESCVMDFELQGGAIGFGKGSATVNLKDVAEGTELIYGAKAQIGGKLAQVGSRLIDSVAKKMADDFFRAFQQAMSPKQPEDVAEHSPEQAAEHVSESSEVNKSVSLSSVASTSSQPKTLSQHSENMVPAWWLFPATVLGAAIMLAGSRWMH
jgi:carbon monoxide dehydrogenase subunit G